MSRTEEQFDVFDLTGATVAGEELSPLQFDRTDYTPFEEFVHHLAQLSDKPRKVHNYALSVNGRVVNDRMNKYLAAPGESSSLLKEVLKSPRHYLIAKNEEVKPSDTRHFELGSFIHSAFLEPSKFDKVRILPKASRVELEGLYTLIHYYWELLSEPQDIVLSDLKIQALRDKLRQLEDIAQERGYTFINAEDCAIINVLRASYKTYGGGILPKLLRYGRPEISMYGIDPATGLKVKIRPDCILLEENVGANIIVSVKTTSESSPDAFMRDAARLRYELSEGMYLEVASHITGRKFTGTLMIMAQTVIPFQVAMIWLDAEDLQIGKYKYRQAMDVVKQCRDANSWPGFDSYAESGAHGILQLRFPDWIKAELHPQYLPE